MNKIDTNDKPSRVNLMHAQRPSRYTDGEFNVIKKPAASVRMALAFPDIYDVGMSHIGLRVLYHIANLHAQTAAERVFHPWRDLEAQMRQCSDPLRALESGRPVRSFDLLGFSLQYELSYTAVLNMLELAGIPIESVERTQDDPVVIAGGPCTVNPLPMRPFIDAFVIGDGEDILNEILDLTHRNKTQGDGTRQALLKGLSQIPGIYVPALHDGTSPILRRYVTDLNTAPFPTSPIVPFADIVHDRVAIEVSRGCTMGCRFCQAGIMYRPLRERSPKTVLDLATESIKNTGYDDVAFTSLSAGDYSCLHGLIHAFNARFPERKVAVSLPSLRVGAVNADVLREISTVRKTGFTIAPEAATARLRAVVNKNFSDEDYERALEALFKEGWQTLKLYYMIGLPTETPADIDAIADMVKKAFDVAKRHAKRKPAISVSVSPFVPKAHTPFQWYGQVSRQYIVDAKNAIRSSLKKATFKGHDADTSVLEGALARGDERVADLIRAAHREGATLDAWTECFDQSRWDRARELSGVDFNEYAMKSYPVDKPLPWDFIDLGVSKKFLRNQYELALQEKVTPDCSERCTGCGLGCRDEGLAEVKSLDTVSPPVTRQDMRPRQNRNPIRVRARFEKTGATRYLSHRELITHITRALNRAGTTLVYTQGFHPAPKLSLGPPLSLGIEGLDEYFDLELYPTIALHLLRERLNSQLAEGIRVLDIGPIGPREQSLQAFITMYVYEVVSPPDLSHIEPFMTSDSHVVQRKKGPVDIRPMVLAVDVKEDGSSVRIVLTDLQEKSVRLDEIASELFGTEVADLDMKRVALYGKVGNDWVSPLKRQ